MCFKKTIYCITVAHLLIAGSLQAQMPQYNVTLLPKLPQMEYMVPCGLNNLGDIVGYWGNDTLPYEKFGFLYLDGTMIDLTEAMNGQSIAHGINDKGQTVGWLYPPEALHSAAFVFSLSEGLKLLDEGALQSAAFAINNAGQIAGYSIAYNYTGSYNYDAKIFLPNGTIVSSGLRGANWAFDINDYYTENGLGEVIINTSSKSPYLYINGTAMRPYYSTGYAFAINNAGEFVGEGWYSNNGEIYSPAGYIYNFKNNYANYLGEGIIPIDINDSSWAIGNLPYPFLLIDGNMYNLYSLISADAEIEWLQVAAINNVGQIAANSNLGVVLMTPVK